MYAKDALVPRSESRRSRKVTVLNKGEVWKIGADGEKIVEDAKGEASKSESSIVSPSPSPSLPSSPSPLRSAASDIKAEYARKSSSPLSITVIAEEEDEEDEGAESTVDGNDDTGDAADDKSSDDERADTVVGSPISPTSPIVSLGPTETEAEATALGGSEPANLEEPEVFDATEGNFDNTELPELDDDDLPGPAENIVTLQGEVSPLPARGLPSFNYKYLNRNVSRAFRLPVRGIRLL